MTQKQVLVGYRLSQGEKGHQRVRKPIVVSGRLSLGVSERIIGIIIISYGKNSLDLRPTWVTTSPRERIEFVSQGPTVQTLLQYMFSFDRKENRQSKSIPVNSKTVQLITCLRILKLVSNLVSYSQREKWLKCKLWILTSIVWHVRTSPGYRVVSWKHI